MAVSLRGRIWSNKGVDLVVSFTNVTQGFSAEQRGWGRRARPTRAMLAMIRSARVLPQATETNSKVLTGRTKKDT